MNPCNQCHAMDREITRQKQEVVRWKARAATYKKKADAAQAKIDALMFEHCPQEMTQAQMDRWALHQKPVNVFLCSVGGRVAPRAMCGDIIVGGKLCGRAGECKFKTPNDPNSGAARGPIAGGPLE